MRQVHVDGVGALRIGGGGFGAPSPPTRHIDDSHASGACAAVSASRDAASAVDLPRRLSAFDMDEHLRERRTAVPCIGRDRP